jgi:kumamolisin
MQAVTRFVPRAVAVSVALTLIACSGGGSSVSPKIALAPITAPAAPASLTSFAYGASLVAGTPVGQPVALRAAHVNVALTLQNATGLAQYAAAASDPTSPLYRHFLTPQQIGASYGATTANYNKVASYFQSFGLKVGGWPQRLALSVSGTQSAMESAFHTHFVSYQTAQHGLLIGPREKPSFSKALPVAAVGNLVFGAGLKHNYLLAGPPGGAGQNLFDGYAPQQVAAAFDYNSAYADGFTGSGINIGIIGTGPISSADYAAYKSEFGVQGSATITQVNVTPQAAAGTFGDGSPTASPPPVTGPACALTNPPGVLPACNPEDGEAQLDTQQTAALGKNANVLFYLAFVPDQCADGSTPTGSPLACPTTSPGNDLGPLIGLDVSDDEIQQAISDNAADVLSLSFGGPESGHAPEFLDANGNYTSSGSGPMEFAALAAEGIAVFVSSGDQGAQGCAEFPGTGAPNAQCVSYPSGDVSVTSVGGVTSPLTNAGQLAGPITAWGQQTSGGFSGSGGGVSQFIPKPAFQTGMNISGAFRLQPDAALIGDPDTGVFVTVNSAFGFAGTPGGFINGPIGGTSVAAPEMAAMWALVLSACKATPACTAGVTGTTPWRMGNAAPMLYKIYNSTNPSLYPVTFDDPSFGNNSVNGCFFQSCPSPMPTAGPGFSAGIGYDEVTGIGVPFARHLIKAVVGV